MASGLYVLIFDAVHDSRIFSFTLCNTNTIVLQKTLVILDLTYRGSQHESCWMIVKF